MCRSHSDDYDEYGPLDCNAKIRRNISPPSSGQKSKPCHYSSVMTNYTMRTFLQHSLPHCWGVLIHEFWHGQCMVQTRNPHKFLTGISEDVKRNIWDLLISGHCSRPNFGILGCWEVRLGNINQPYRIHQRGVSVQTRNDGRNANDLRQLYDR
jgi:hypothetical protein